MVPLSEAAEMIAAEVLSALPVDDEREQEACDEPPASWNRPGDLVDDASASEVDGPVSPWRGYGALEAFLVGLEDADAFELDDRLRRVVSMEIRAQQREPARDTAEPAPEPEPEVEPGRGIGAQQRDREETCSVRFIAPADVVQLFVLGNRRQGPRGPPGVRARRMALQGPWLHVHAEPARPPHPIPFGRRVGRPGSAGPPPIRSRRLGPCP
jgi:hypothetical protein